MFAIVDIETTGGSPKNGRIIEIAIVVHNGERVIEEYATLVNPNQTIDPFVVALTGISDEMVEDAPTFEQVSDTVEKLTKNRVLVAHNARFDYGFIKHEFRRLGQRYQRRNLCTIKMSKKLLPNQPSYSLGRLCEDLDIPIKNRHRALGDAAATAVLLEKLIFSEKKQLVQELLKDELAEANLPASISRKEIDELPEEVGIYYFLDQKQKPLYIGKSKNIRSRVLNHFTNDLHSSRFKELKDKVFEIDYEILGSELISEIKEAGEIKRFMPPFNMAQKRKKYRYGLYCKEDDNGYFRLKTELLNPEKDSIIKFTSKSWADKIAKRIINDFDLSQERRLKSEPDEYNKRVETAIQSYKFSEPNVLFIDTGRDCTELSVIQIENGKYVGYGYFDSTHIDSDNIEQLISSVTKDYNTPDKEQIIRKYLRKKNNIQRISYSNEE